MENPSSNRHGPHLERQLANLKLVARLLTHELHSQGGAKTVTLARDEVLEIKTTIELFVEEVGRRQSTSAPPRPTEPAAVHPRNNN